MNKFSLLIFDIIKNRKTSFFLNDFKAKLRLQKNEIADIQFEKLKKLLIHCEKNVPFYSKRFKEINFSTQEFRDIGQYNKIPVLTRQDIQDFWSEIVAQNYNIDELSKGSSSGSTGLPVVYYKDRLAESAGQAANLLGWMFSNWKMGMKGIHIWGNPSTVNNEWKRISSRLKAKIFEHHKFPAYKLTDGANFYELYKLIIKNKYDYIDGYTNAIYLFAEYLKHNNLKFKHKIQCVLTTAENLQEYQRNLIEETVAPVFDSYGCSEINGIAFECNQCRSYHIIDPHVYVEFGNIVDEIGSQELIITDLDNYAFPFIRYQNGDTAIPQRNVEKKCTIKFSQLQQVSGRESDIIRFKDGGTLSVPSFFGSMLLKRINGLKQYQIERLDDDLIIINLVKNTQFQDIDYQTIQSALNEYLKDKIRYEIRFVKKIESSPSGKFKLLIDRTR